MGEKPSLKVNFQTCFDAAEERDIKGSTPLISGGRMITDGKERHRQKMMIFNYLGSLYRDTDSDLITDIDSIDFEAMAAAEPFVINIDDDEDEGSSISIDYDAGIYLPSSIESFIDIFKQELEVIVPGPETPVQIVEDILPFVAVFHGAVDAHVPDRVGIRAPGFKQKPVD